jgi:NADH-quinone oxidoreductase subunit L
MVGPTPVSALIHAATMVTAGVYMVARLHFLYELAPVAMHLVATVGAVTALYAATIAIVQPDIKRVLAYSTISQLGYMFLGVGVGAYAAGIFHLMTHAFFKGLLFLCAGSVIHAMSGEQDMNRMGALRRRLPVTFATMLVATLAITAVPGFSGYFSKDLILEAAYTSGHVWLWLIGVIAAGFTAFYMFRLIFLTFFGASRVDPQTLGQLHESPPVMTVPLLILAFFAAVSGLIGLPHGLLWGDVFARFLAPVLGEFRPEYHASAVVLSAFATGAGAVGFLLAYLCYIRSPELPARVAARASFTYGLLLRKFYVDELYDLLVTRPLFFISTTVLGRAVDSVVIDGAVDGTGVTVEGTGRIARRIATGNVQHYALLYLTGALVIAAYYVWMVMAS